ncbi:hypothetical protein [Methyloglobulus sp.]|uniref:hypothetical protein n=1 Tax=Methyloglobulus sp. TaxID=2518622 RepID=UPI003989408C
MQNRGLSEFKSFSGSLQANGCVAPVTFRARINPSGEVEFDFDEIAITKETSFIEEHWRHKGSSLSYFSLIGKAEDGTEITTESLYFSSSGFSGLSYHMSFSGGHCSRAKFHRKLVEPKPKPWLRMLLKSFRSAHPLKWQCRLGTISMLEFPPDDIPDAITGFIIVESDNENFDLSVWHDEANKLLDHVRLVMSFASGLILPAPVIEFYMGDKLEVVVSSPIRQASSASFPVFGYVNQQPIFKVAVTSFFDPPFVVQNLFIAIDWFAMGTTYAEVRLVNTMTVLENLIASNLGESDMLILPDKKEFEKYRRTLRKVLKQCIKKWSRDETKNEDILSDINERLADLNRRSIIQKLNILAERWSVPLDGITPKQIKAAKNARDSIVHRGHYDKDGSSKELWKHAMVVREIVIRFLFTAIGYQGKYISQLGGYHEAQFPPIINGD